MQKDIGTFLQMEKKHRTGLISWSTWRKLPEFTFFPSEGPFFKLISWSMVSSRHDTLLLVSPPQVSRVGRAHHSPGLSLGKCLCFLSAFTSSFGKCGLPRWTWSGASIHSQTSHSQQVPSGYSETVGSLAWYDRYHFSPVSQVRQKGNMYLYGFMH